MVNNNLSNKMIFRNLDWDSEYFGVRCGRIDLKENITVNEQHLINQFIKDYDFITITNSKNCNLNNEYIGKELKAFLTDVNVQFEKEITGRLEIDNRIKIYNCYPQNESLVAMVATAYRNSRFLNDSQISHMKASGIYQNWVKNSFDKENKYFITYEEGECIKGFLICSISDKRNLIIELICVSETYKGNGIGKLLMRSSEKLAGDNNLLKIKVGTQIENISALNFYKSCGFRLVDVSYIYHLWH